MFSVSKCTVIFSFMLSTNVTKESTAHVARKMVKPIVMTCTSSSLVIYGLMVIMFTFSSEQYLGNRSNSLKPTSYSGSHKHTLSTHLPRIQVSAAAMLLFNYHGETVVIAISAGFGARVSMNYDDTAGGVVGYAPPPPR